MKEELINTVNCQLPNLVQTNNFSKGSNYFENVGTINSNVYYQMPNRMISFPELSNEYYNLIVLDEDCIGNGTRYSIDRHKYCNATDITEKEKKQFGRIDENTIEKLKMFPTLLLSKNKEYTKAGDMQKAYYGFIASLEKCGDQIVFEFANLKDFNQQLLNEAKEQFGILGNDFKNEIDKEHWTIKKIDAQNALRNNGVIIPKITY